MIWFSVILDANIPNDTYTITKSRNPNNVTNVVAMCGVPKKHKIAKYIRVNTSANITNNVAAINLPSTICVILTGDVNNNCSVPFFLSSEKERIVSAGTISARAKIVGNIVYMYSNFTAPPPNKI